MKSIFLSDSDKEVNVEFIKQHEELYDKTQQVQRQALGGRTLGETSSFQELICQHCQEVVRDSTYQIYQAHSKSGQAAEKNIGRYTWFKDSFSFLRGHIRRKGVSKSSKFKSPLRPSAPAATASVPDTSRETKSEMEISMTSNVTHQPSTTTLHDNQLLLPTLLLKN